MLCVRIVQHTFINQAMMRGKIIRIDFGIDFGIYMGDVLERLIFLYIIIV